MFLKNQVNLITGACGRIGSATSKECAKLGSDLIIADIDIQELKNLRTLILNSYNIEVLAIECDVTKHSDLKSLIKKSFNFRGFVNGAINSAYPTSSKWGCKFEELEEENLKADLFSQLGSAILFSKEISKLFVNQGYGNLINISSIQGISAPKFDHYDGTDMNSPIEYAAIKSGIIAITKWLAKYYFNKNIRINCISPGGIKDNQPESFLNKYRSSCSNIGMLSSEKHISEILAFLLSDASKAINGQNIVIDDGWSL